MKKEYNKPRSLSLVIKGGMKINLKTLFTNKINTLQMNTLKRHKRWILNYYK